MIKMDGFYRGLIEMQIRASRENTELPWTPKRKRKRSSTYADGPLTTHVLVVGDPGVGKTSYINKKLGRKFNPSYQPTDVISAYYSPGVVWYDYPGEENIDTTKIDAPINLVIYMYDITSKMSYDNLEQWKRKIQSKYGKLNSVEIGNKMDLASSIKIRGGVFQNSNRTI